MDERPETTQPIEDMLQADIAVHSQLEQRTRRNWIVLIATSLLSTMGLALAMAPLLRRLERRLPLGIHEPRAAPATAALIGRASGLDMQHVAAKIMAYDALARKINDSGVTKLPAVSMTAD